MNPRQRAGVLKFGFGRVITNSGLATPFKPCVGIAQGFSINSNFSKLQFRYWFKQCEKTFVSNLFEK
jgi:hypothetical protein